MVENKTMHQSISTKEIALRAGLVFWQEHIKDFGKGRVNKEGWITVHSPFREDANPSFSINIQHGGWNDFATGEKGDIVDFYALKMGLTNKQAFKELAKKYMNDIPSKNGTSKKTLQHKDLDLEKPAPEMVREISKKKARIQEENITATYTYTDINGVALYQSVRFEEEGCEKTFRQRRKMDGDWVYRLGDVETVLYRLPELIEHIALDRVIYIVEGEKDVETLREKGIPATCNPMGAGKWKEEYNTHFTGARVAILPDNDISGEKHAESVARHLHNIAASIQIVTLPNLPAKGDITDWIKMGGTVEELYRLTEEAPFYMFQEQEQGAKEEREKPPLDDEKPSKIQRIENYLTHFWEFRYNIMEDEPEYKLREGNKAWVKVEDRFASSVIRKMEYDGMAVSANRLRSILISDFSPEFDPFHDFFTTLPAWDGHDYISEYANIIPVRQRDYDTLHLYFRKWLIAAVATALGRGRSPNQTCLILIGSQGDGKTNFLRTLAPKPLKNYYTEAKIKRNDKDSEIMIARNFIINFDELQGLRKDEIEEFKSLGVRSFVKVRRQYATFTTVMRRTASFVGSTNQEDFLTDLTGARRFLCVKVHGRIQWQSVTDELVMGAYSQAMHLLNKGVQYWFTDEEINHINEQNEAFRQTLLEEELLLMWFKPTTWENGHEYLTNTEILTRLQVKAPNTRIDPKNLGRALRKHGFIQQNRKRSGVSLKCYAVQALLNSSTSNISSDDDDEKQPF